MAIERATGKPAKAKPRRSGQAPVTVDAASAAMIAGASDLFASKIELDEQAYELRRNRDTLAGRSTEKAIADAVLLYLGRKSDGQAHIVEIKEVLPNILPLTSADLEQSATRESESLWEQQVRNLISHRQTPGNYIKDGLLRYVGSGTLKVTDAGKQRLAQMENREDFGFLGDARALARDSG